MARFTHRSLLALCLSLAVPGQALAEEILVFAASSLKTALDQIATEWQKETGNRVLISYEGSPKLAKQIQEGAPADLFISASSQWMDLLADEGLIATDSRRDILSNTMVLIAADAHAAPVAITHGFDLKALLGDDKLSMATVNSVPAGQYGKEALENLGVWHLVEPQVAQSENVRAALALVATAEAPYGIVFASDAIADDQADNKVSVVGTFPADSHKPIVYPAALLAASVQPEARAFLEALSSNTAAAVFMAQGFTVLK